MDIHYIEEGKIMKLPAGKEGFVLKVNISLWTRILLRLGIKKSIWK